MASSNHQDIIAKAVNRSFTADNGSLCVLCGCPHLMGGPNVFKLVFNWNWLRGCVPFQIWLISRSHVRRGKKASLPSFSLMTGEMFDVVPHGMLLFIPFCNKSHMVLLFQTIPCYFELWRKRRGMWHMTWMALMWILQDTSGNCQWGIEQNVF